MLVRSNDLRNMQTKNATLETKLASLKKDVALKEEKTRLLRTERELKEVQRDVLEKVSQALDGLASMDVDNPNNAMIDAEFEILEPVLMLLKETKTPSISLLQRRFKVQISDHKKAQSQRLNLGVADG